LKYERNHTESLVGKKILHPNEQRELPNDQIMEVFEENYSQKDLLRDNKRRKYFHGSKIN